MIIHDIRVPVTRAAVNRVRTEDAVLYACLRRRYHDRLAASLSHALVIHMRILFAPVEDGYPIVIMQAPIRVP